MGEIDLHDIYTTSKLGSNGKIYMTFTCHLHDINTTSTGIKWEDRFTRHLHDINTTSTGIKWEDRFTWHLHDINTTSIGGQPGSNGKIYMTFTHLIPVDVVLMLCKCRVNIKIYTTLTWQINTTN